MLSEADQDCALPSCEVEAACTAGPLSLSEGKAQSDMDTRHTPCSESVFFFFLVWEEQGYSCLPSRVQRERWAKAKHISAVKLSPTLLSTGIFFPSKYAWEDSSPFGPMQRCHFFNSTPISPF